MYYLQITVVASYRQLPLASYYFINTVVWLIFDLKHSEITQKKIKQFYYDNTMVNFCKGCDVHMFFVEEITEAVSSIAKRWPEIKDICIY